MPRYCLRYHWECSKMCNSSWAFSLHWTMKQHCGRRSRQWVLPIFWSWVAFYHLQKTFLLFRFHGFQNPRFEDEYGETSGIPSMGNYETICFMNLTNSFRFRWHNDFWVSWRTWLKRWFTSFLVTKVWNTSENFILSRLKYSPLYPVVSISMSWNNRICCFVIDNITDSFCFFALNQCWTILCCCCCCSMRFWITQLNWPNTVCTMATILLFLFLLLTIVSSWLHCQLLLWHCWLLHPLLSLLLFAHNVDKECPFPVSLVTFWCVGAPLVW